MMLKIQTALLLGSALCPLVAASKLPTVNLGYEIHQATFNDSGQYYNFSNVRYGAAPLGNLRFAAPVSPASTSHPVFNDGSKAVTCVQAVPAWTNTSAAWVTNGTAAFNISAGYHPPKLTTLPPIDPETNEDCLFLDVMVPKSIFDNAGRGAGAPVMVWIHGGGYTLGSKTLYSPSAAGLLKASQSKGKEGMIWVGMNYRLGIFGFLSGPTFQSEGTANAGLLDQRLALDWVKDNIHKFGGDPGRVTLVGESAGGGSTLHQITAYGGLKGPVPFQQAIVQSPGFQPTPSAIEEEAIYQDFLSTAGVGNLQAARGLSTEALQLVNYKMVGESTPYGTFTFNPTVDGNFAPALPGRLLLQGNYDKSLRVMTGHNILEGLEFMDAFAQSEARFERDFHIYFPTITDAAVTYISKTLYPPVFDGSHGYTSQTGRGEVMVTEGFFTCNTNWLAHAYGNKTFGYLFSVPPSLHGQDIPYTYYDGPNPAVQNDTLALTMQAYFANFVVNKDPNGPGLPHFPQYGAGGTLLNFNLSSISTTTDNLNVTRCAWWQKGLYF